GLHRKLASRSVAARRQSLRNGRHGGECLGMVQRLHGSLPRHFQKQPARTAFGRETDISGRELEVALQQPAGNDAWRQCAKLLLQRSRFPDCLRVRSVDVSLRETQSRLPLVRNLLVRKSKSHPRQTTKP